MRTVCLATLLVASGCVQNARTTIANRHAAEFGCAARDVEVASAGYQPGRTTGQFSAEGCGVRSMYVCRLGTCVRDSEAVPDQVAAEAVEPSVRSSSLDPQLSYARDDGRVVGLRATFHTIDSEIVFTYVPARRLDEATVRIDTTTAVPLVGCEVFVLADGPDRLDVPIRGGVGRVALSELLTPHSGRMRARFCRRSWLLRTPDIAAWDLFRQRAQETREAHVAAMQRGVRSPVETPDEAIRGRLTAEASLIQACVTAAGPAGVEATWTGEGRVTIRVPSSDDAAVQGCLDTAFAGWQVPTESSGRLLHVVR